MSTQLANLSDVLMTLSNTGCLRMFEKVNRNTSCNGGGVQILRQHDETPRQYYLYLTKLKEAHLIKKAGPQMYRPTALGRLIYGFLQNSKAACSLSWNLHALDQLDEKKTIPLRERKNLIHSLIPDPVLQRILFQEVESL